MSDRAQSKLRAVVAALDKFNLFNKVSSAVGMVIIFAMAVIIFTDAVVLRYVFRRPLSGSNEIVAVMLVTAVFLGIAYAQTQRAHVNVNLITSRLSPKVQLVLDTITSLLSIGIFALVCWQTLEYFLYVLDMGRTSWTLGIPIAPFAFIVFFGCTALLIVLLRDFISNVAEGLSSHFGVGTWTLMLSITVLVMVGLALWALVPIGEIPLPAIGLIGLLVLFVLLFSGMPVAFVLLMVATIFLAHTTTVTVSLNTLGATLFNSTAEFTWAVAALFTLMSFICMVSGLGADLFWSANKWIGHLSGGLGIATIAASTGFAAIVGDPVTSSISIGTVAIPEMRKYKYSAALSTGSIVAGATLGPMIPPSLAFIIYGLFAQVSIGKLFLAGIIPGLILAASYALLIYGRCRVNPLLGPPAERSTWRERFVSLKVIGPIGLLFLLVIGGIYGGLFTPCEAGGVGAFGAFIIALVMRRLNWQKFVLALTSAGKLVSMLFLLIGGAVMFGYFMAFSGLPQALSEGLVGLGLPPIMIIVIILLIYLIFGCLMNGAPVLLITLPVFIPIADALGYDLVWFGVIVVMMCNLGFLTPPFGLGVFVLRSVAPDIPIGTMFRGIGPFVPATLVAIAIVVAFPELATWLPSLI